MSFTVAIMQPYFAPYAGYFRLMAGADLFVVYDCVQFPRRGWVHRNKLVDRTSAERWLTLPLASAAQEVLIKDLAFVQNAAAELAERLRPFPIDRRPQTEAAAGVLDRVRAVEGAPTDYIEGVLRATCEHLGLRWNSIRSSTLALPDDLRGQDRIVEIARRVSAQRYVNAPGGRGLYDAATFAEAGMTLGFLPPYAGPTRSILDRILDEDAPALRADILDFKVEP